MGSDKSLLRRVSVRRSGRKHLCSRNKAHVLSKNNLMLVVTEGRNEKHYCVACAARFVKTAQGQLGQILEGLEIDASPAGVLEV